MLYVIFNDNREVTWHVGYKEDLARIKQAAPEVREIQADGDELERILRNFTIGERSTIPRTSALVQSWYGDLAKTIILNL